MINADIIATVAAAIALGSAIVSVLAIYIPWRNTHDAEIFKEAVSALIRSYETLTSHGTVICPPTADRLNWLTAARHIEAFKSLKLRLKTDLYVTLCKENEEYWRHQFYLSLLRHSTYTFAYFNNAEIEPRSALVLFSFAAWPKGQPDPIDQINFRALLEESNYMRTNFGFREYLKKFPKYATET
ncbi:MAG: hypothetical protein CVU35_02330 [Betaproteobacteria bacterium HGW-Betaproteobacteria-8]|nr:MAG: hypothetical protein CVU35_02330 [Betaproteobacteria bacterium HGW-Betaproteobacteria-8]